MDHPFGRTMSGVCEVSAAVHGSDEVRQQYRGCRARLPDPNRWYLRNRLSAAHTATIREEKRAHGIIA